MAIHHGHVIVEIPGEPKSRRKIPADHWYNGGDAFQKGGFVLVQTGGEPVGVQKAQVPTTQKGRPAKPKADELDTEK